MLKLWKPLVIASDATLRQLERFYIRARLLAAFGGHDEVILLALAAIDQALPARPECRTGDWHARLSAEGPHQAEFGRAAGQHVAHSGRLRDAVDVRHFETRVAGPHVR